MMKDKRRNVLESSRAVLAMVFVAFLLPDRAQGAYALYQFEGSNDSKCVPKVSNPKGILSANGMRTQGGTGEEMQSLANGIAKVQHLLKGRRLPSSWAMNIQYVTVPNSSGKWTWNQGLSRAGWMTVRRPRGSANGRNETRLIHELGHKVGASGGLYGRYNRAVGKKCRLTPYCSHKSKWGARNEEFAETFAAFVTRPAALKSQCPQAYAFFSKQVFPGSNAVAECGDSFSGGTADASAEEEIPKRAQSPGKKPENVRDEAEYDRSQCKNLLCFLFGKNRNYRTQDDSGRSKRPGGGDR